MNVNCGMCRYWKPVDTKNSGECHRRAPIKTFSGQTFFWPGTKRDEWCGEYDPSDATIRKAINPDKQYDP
jgi:hypothetical protein